MPFFSKLFGLVVFFFVLAAIFAIAEHFWPSVRQPRRLIRGRRTDITYFLFSPTLGKLFSGVLVFGSVMSLAYLTIGPLSNAELKGVEGRDTFLGRQPGLLQLFEITILADFIGYWSHRAFHEVSTLWKIHAIHHSSTQLDWPSSVPVPPVNDAANNTLVAPPPNLLAGP